MGSAGGVAGDIDGDVGCLSGFEGGTDDESGDIGPTGEGL